MADIHLTQSEAEALIAMEKHRLDDERYSCPFRVKSRRRNDGAFPQNV